MTREIADGFHWIQETGPDRRRLVERPNGETPNWYEPGHALYIPNNVYLLSDERSLLFDTLSPASTDVILETLDDLLDGDGLDYLVVSHPDVPHAGNTPAILREHPEATLVAPRYGTGHELYHLDDAELVGEGDSIDLGRYTVSFHEAPFLDAALHMWMTEETTGTLFPVDWFGYPHIDDENLAFADEFETPVDVDRLVEFHGRVLFWFEYVDLPKTLAEIDRIVATHDPDVVAPAHGNVVRRDLDEYVRMMKRAVERISERGFSGSLG